LHSWCALPVSRRYDNAEFAQDESGHFPAPQLAASIAGLGPSHGCRARPSDMIGIAPEAQVGDGFDGGAGAVCRTNHMGFSVLICALETRRERAVFD
jgi:hypothetical protein